MNTAYLLMGANLGNRMNNLMAACDLLQRQVGRITRYSSVYETASWGNTSQPAFLNQALLVETYLSAEETMQKILLIEKEMGRVRTERNASRIIDIDILFFNKDIIQTKTLTVPHPQIQNRNFVLYPLQEIASGFEHPLLKKTIRDLLLQCSDELSVKLYEI